MVIGAHTCYKMMPTVGSGNTSIPSQSSRVCGENTAAFSDIYSVVHFSRRAVREIPRTSPSISGSLRSLSSISHFPHLLVTTILLCLWVLFPWLQISDTSETRRYRGGNFCMCCFTCLAWLPSSLYWLLSSCFITFEPHFLKDTSLTHMTHWRARLQSPSQSLSQLRFHYVGDYLVNTCFFTRR